MNTPAHAIIAASVFGKPLRPTVTAATVFGGLVPDISLFVLVVWARFVEGDSMRSIFDERYFSDSWALGQAVFNSIIVYALLLAIACWRRWPHIIAFAGGAALHVLCDFPLHHDDAHAHFWPVTMWVFESPVSYYDPDHFGVYAGLAEVVLVLGLCAYLWRRHRACLWRRHRAWWARALIVTAALLEVVPELGIAAYRIVG